MNHLLVRALCSPRRIISAAEARGSAATIQVMIKSDGDHLWNPPQRTNSQNTPKPFAGGYGPDGVPSDPPPRWRHSGDADAADRCATRSSASSQSVDNLLAFEEAEAAARWYADRSLTAAAGFSEEIDAAEEAIAQRHKSYLRVLRATQMALGEGHARTRLQVLFERNRALLVGEFDDHINRPRPTARSVWRTSRIVCFDTRSDIGRQAGVVTRRIMFTLQNVNEAPR